MEKVVYLLGAGFSASLGLPVMADFLVKSKDLFAREPEKYAHFEKVFKTIDELHKCKSYFDADLFNIEEILSILEMREGLEASSEVRSFIKYIKDVIQFYTPELKPPPDAFSNGLRPQFIFGEPKWAKYGAFVACLFGLRFVMTPPLPPNPGPIKFAQVSEPKAEYSVLSLNYDLVLEKLSAFLNEHHPSQKKIRFVRDFSKKATEHFSNVPLTKLHGSVDSDQIIAPTWNKTLASNLVSNWKKAHELIAEANHIRILGYSLPVSDAYIKYLLKSAVVSSQNLKNIDVICLGSVARKNYKRFVRFNFYRFKERDLEGYLSGLLQHIRNSHSPDSNNISFDTLESFHENFMNQLE